MLCSSTGPPDATAQTRMKRKSIGVLESKKPRHGGRNVRIGWHTLNNKVNRLSLTSRSCAVGSWCIHGELCKKVADREGIWKDMNLDDANLIRLIALKSFLHGLASLVVGTTIYLELCLRRAFIWIDDIWIWYIFDLFRQCGVHHYDNKVGLLLWRMATYGFGRKSNAFEFLGWNSFWRPLNSQLLVYFDLAAFFLFKEQKGQLKERHEDTVHFSVWCVVKGASETWRDLWSVSCLWICFVSVGRVFVVRCFGFERFQYTNATGLVYFHMVAELV